jgi:hypothetical protein
MNPTGSVVAEVSWAKMLVTEVSKMPAARRRTFGVEGLMMMFFITACGWFKAEFERSVGIEGFYLGAVKRLMRSTLRTPHFWVLSQASSVP